MQEQEHFRKLQGLTTYDLVGCEQFWPDEGPGVVPEEFHVEEVEGEEQK